MVPAGLRHGLAGRIYGSCLGGNGTPGPGACPLPGALTGVREAVPKLRHPERTGLHIRVVLDGGVAVGPGRADLLQGIADAGSIAAAARAMGMSYRRAWLLVEDTAKAFGAPVVVAATGGADGGHARLTELGAAIVALYREIERKAGEAASGEMAALQALMREPGAPG